MIQCKHFEKCSAPICICDSKWEQRTHLDGDRVCYWLTEFSKPDARSLLRGCLPSEMHSRLVELYPIIVERVGPIRRQLRRSAKNPPRVKAVGYV